MADDPNITIKILQNIQADLQDLRAEMATRAEMRELRAEMATRADMREMRGDLRAEMSELRADMGDVRTELRAEIREVRTEMGEVRVEMRAMHDDLRGRIVTLTEFTNGQFAIIENVMLDVSARTHVVSGQLQQATKRYDRELDDVKVRLTNLEQP